MRTSPAPGLGISRSTISKSAPGLGICAAFIGAIAIFVVAIVSPLEFWFLLRQLENYFQLHRHPERKTLHSEHQARRHLFFSEDVAEKFGGRVGNFQKVLPIPRGRYVD